MIEATYDWSKEDYPESNGLKVFSCFACGGGSTMGYKLAGYNVIGATDIDDQMAKIYKLNHNPQYYFLEDIRDFNKRDDLPEELFNLDILDGSPPCSTFSMAGKREKKWGKEKTFREGQVKQVLDDLFSEFIKTVEKLKPKIVIAENVKGIIQGNAKGFLIEVVKQLEEIGYITQTFLLNSATMGVPQKRERVFVIAYRSELTYPKLELDFKSEPIPFKEISGTTVGKEITPAYDKYWKNCIPGRSLSSVHPNGLFFNSQKLSYKKVVPTVISTEAGGLLHPEFPNRISNESIIKAQSFPRDYDFNNLSVQYVCGMSVPPIMMAKIAFEILNQWLIPHNPINER